MEGRSTTATWDGERLTVHVATQGVAACREMLAALFSLEMFASIKAFACAVKIRAVAAAAPASPRSA